MRSAVAAAVLAAAASVVLAQQPQAQIKYDIFGGIITKETKLDKWARGTIKSVEDNKIVVESGSFEPGALKGRVINPNFERPLDKEQQDREVGWTFGDTPQFSCKYYKIIDNTADTITTDPADGKLTQYARAGDKYLLCGFYSVRKVKDRFVMFTPLGHPYIGFGPDSTYPGVFGYLPGERNKNIPPEKDGWKIKYDGNYGKWYAHFMEQMGKVGFNMSAGYFRCVPMFASTKSEVFVKPDLPFIAWYHALESGMRDKANGGLFDSPIKDVIDGVGHDWASQRTQGDIFDPQFDKACEIMSQQQAVKMKNNPWFIGYILEESDFLMAYARDRNTFHLGWGVMVSQPQQQQSTRDLLSKPKFTDTKNYTKFKLRDMIKAKYGTIEKLNEAWGSDYTTWDETKEGYGKGKGFLDEDGKLGAKWLGAWHTGKGGGAKCLEDLEAFIPVYAAHLHKVETQYLRKADPNHMIICSKVPQDLNEYNAVAPYVDMLRGLPPKGAAGDFVKPGLMAVYLSADLDSTMYVFYKDGNGPGQGSLKTQEEKARTYRQQLLDGWNYSSDGKIYPMVLVSYWAWNENIDEKRNWGVVSLKDNLYDGKEATKLGADGKAGTWDDEDRDYGDCVTGFKAAHEEMLNMLKNFIQKDRATSATKPSSKEPMNWIPEDQY